MTSLVHICAWLFHNPRFARLWLTTRALLRLLVNCLVDLETTQPRDLPLGVAPAIDSSLQLAETCVTRLIWLRAREIAGLPHIRNTRSFAYIPPRRLRSAGGFAIHALNLLDRFWRIEPHARRLAARMSQQAERQCETPAHRTSFADNSKIPTSLILRTRKARGIQGWRHPPKHKSERRFATLIPQTGPPHPPHPLQHPQRQLRNPPIPETRTHAPQPIQPERSVPSFTGGPSFGQSRMARGGPQAPTPPPQLSSRNRSGIHFSTPTTPE